eukprot:c31423_g1_i1 orf=118-732(+)
MAMISMADKQGGKRVRNFSDDSDELLGSVKQSEPYLKKSSDIISSSHADFASLWEALADEEDQKENSWLSPDQEKLLSDLMASLEKEIGEVSQSQPLSSSVQHISHSDAFNPSCFSLCDSPSLDAYTRIGIDFEALSRIEDGVFTNCMHTGTSYCSSGENPICSLCTSVDDYIYRDLTMNMPLAELVSNPDLQTESRADQLVGW